MFDTILTSTLLATAIIALAEALAISRRQLARLQARLVLLEQRSGDTETAWAGLTAQLTASDQELTAVAAATRAIEARQTDLGARFEVLETQSTSDQPYGNAIRLVRQGAREARLVDELGLNPIEAALIVRLHSGTPTH